MGAGARARAAAVMALAACALAGCYCSHRLENGDDGGGPADAAADAGPGDAGRPPADVGAGDAALRGGAYWTLEERTAFLSVDQDPGCIAHGGRLVVQAGLPIDDDCTVGGPAVIDGERDGAVVVRSYVWVRRGGEPCQGIAAYAERHVLVLAEAGTLRVVNGDGSAEVEVVVQPPDPRPCEGGGVFDAPCSRDCECGGELVCVPSALLGGAECVGGRCRHPCDSTSSTFAPFHASDLDCPAAGLACARWDDLAAPTCEPRTADDCSDVSSCGDGLECVESPEGHRECRWTTMLESPGRACEGDLDCGTGLQCVEHADGARRCEWRCFTATMRCPGAWACHPPPDGPGVCVFIGE